MKHKKLKIDGMHCVSCEILIGNKTNGIKGLSVKDVCHKKGEIDIKFTDEKSFNELISVLKQAGFEISDSSSKASGRSAKKLGQKDLFHLAGISIIVLILGYFIHKFNIYQYVPNMESANYGVAMLIGLIASVSSCLAVTGGIIIGFSEFIDDSKGIGSHCRVQGMFQIGRLLGFFIFGGILGIIGKVFQISMGFTGFLSVFIGFVLIYMGFTIVGITPSITKLGFHLPKFLTKNIFTVKNPIFSPLVGALTFFLPCGFTQTMQLLAIASGNFLTGGLIMLSFAIGTAPVLFSIGFGSSYVKDRNFDILNKIIAVLVIFFGIFTIVNGKNLLFIKNTDIISGSQLESETEFKYEKVNIGHNGWSLEPQITKLKAGKNYEITIIPGVNGNGCMSTLIMPAIEYKAYNVMKGEPIVYKIENAKKGKYPAICTSMGMYQGEILVE